MLRMIVEWGAKKLKTLRALPFAGALLCIMQCCMRVLARPSLPLSPLSPLVPEHFASACAIVLLLLCGVGAPELEAHRVPEARADSSRRVALGCL
jgi:hypothetical protein